MKLPLIDVRLVGNEIEVNPEQSANKPDPTIDVRVDGNTTEINPVHPAKELLPVKVVRMVARAMFPEQQLLS